MDDKPKEQRRWISDDADDSENVSNSIHLNTKKTAERVSNAAE